jgi:uncharacterized protein YndB with AHSA1/START domain
MGTLTVTRTIDAPREVVFDVLTNAARYPEYTPIRRVERERTGSEAPDGVGAVRALHLAGPPLRERVLAYEPPHRFSFGSCPGRRSAATRGTRLSSRRAPGRASPTGWR